VVGVVAVVPVVVVVVVVVVPVSEGAAAPVVRTPPSLVEALGRAVDGPECEIDVVVTLPGTALVADEDTSGAAATVTNTVGMAALELSSVNELAPGIDEASATVVEA
jgi:hypothetical protein